MTTSCVQIDGYEIPVARHLGYFCISYVNLYHQNNLGDEQPGYQVTYVCAPQVSR
jgi:hypothetical protein